MKSLTLAIVLFELFLALGSHASQAATGVVMDKFAKINSEDITWTPFPPVEGIKIAVLIGQTDQSAPYLIRVKVPDNVKIFPHKHSENRIYTVISGVFYIGLGDKFDPDKLVAYAPGSIIIVPAGLSHFHWAKSGEYVSQIYGIGPLGFEYIDSNNDPRIKKTNH
ncbi:MAG: cupin domain-containing protein [Nitrospirota bacterium]